ncbi:protein-L-isoaspartate(D-aspartate) O-methyltransferase [Thalassolituus sp. LLYu03]|uniref:protein-L-isoaspartate(D-aspartate) O-methyltransferase n=1 Tax=Thalassolituus sp. LLYu03 TaxID=3421656 RepID=UPI003D26AC4D
MDHLRTGIGMTSQRTRNRLVQRLRESGIKDERVLEVIASTPRHLFVDEALAHRAYEDTALPIGNGQTISQPYTVARMTEVLLAAGPLDKVLEIGTGSGYQTAVLSPLVGRLFSVERIEPLQHKAAARLKELGYRNLHLKLSDGTWGWPEFGPYDGILAAAAPENVPDSLLQQLADGGRLILPVGTEEQKLVLITRHGDHFTRKTLESVRFVPFLPGVQR